MRIPCTPHTLFTLIIGFLFGVVLSTSLGAWAQLWPTPYEDANQQLWQQQQRALQQESLQRLRQQDFQHQMEAFPRLPGPASRPPC